MADQELSPEDQQELNELAGMVAESLSKGEKPADITKQLVNSGWEQAEADQFVSSIGQQLVKVQQSGAQSGDEGGGMGWLVWIGLLLLINFLSWVFGWGFWLY